LLVSKAASKSYEAYIAHTAHTQQTALDPVTTAAVLSASLKNLKRRTDGNYYADEKATQESQQPRLRNNIDVISGEDYSQQNTCIESHELNTPNQIKKRRQTRRAVKKGAQPRRSSNNVTRGEDYYPQKYHTLIIAPTRPPMQQITSDDVENVTISWQGISFRAPLVSVRSSQLLVCLVNNVLYLNKL